MKTLKKINLAILAIVLGFGLVVTQSAFKAPKSDVTIYQYDGTTNLMADFKQGEWIEVDPEDAGCSGTNVVCRIGFNGDINDLHDFLDITTNPQDVIDLQVAEKL